MLMPIQAQCPLGQSCLPLQTTLTHSHKCGWRCLDRGLEFVVSGKRGTRHMKWGYLKPVCTIKCLSL